MAAPAVAPSDPANELGDISIKNITKTLPKSELQYFEQPK